MAPGRGACRTRRPKGAKPLPLAPLALLAPLTRMPNATPIIPRTYRKRAKGAKEAKGTTDRGATTATPVARDATCATHGIPTDSKEEAQHEKGKRHGRECADPL